MPQLSESFLDRIVDMTKSNADRMYRQKLNDEIKTAALAIVPLQEIVQYDKDLIGGFKKPAARPDPATAANLTREFQSVREEMRRLIGEMNDIYQLASRQLNPATEMYRITGPAVFRVERTISLGRIALMGLITLLIAIPIVLAGILIHNRIREEETAEQQTRASETITS